MADPCDLCGSHSLQAVYEPEDTQRGLKIYACEQCGLLQSWPRRDRAPRAKANVSAGADWGNLRYGKGFRVAPHMEMLTRHFGLNSPSRVLDVGSNRGAFLDAALAVWPRATITAVEPDDRVTQGYAIRMQVALLSLRIEDCGFEEEIFDLIYSSHTLEHVAPARRVMLQHSLTLKPGGLLLLEVPNNAILGSSDIVEEWFIDKHLNHYSNTTLSALLKSTGFEVVEGPKLNDREYLTVLARPSFSSIREMAFDPAEFDRSRGLVQRYVQTRRSNVAALKRAAKTIMARKGRVAIWGAGRLFDALVRQGGLDPSKLSLVIDENLRSHMSERHGVKLAGSDALRSLDPDLIVVASRSFAGEIVSKAALLAPRATIVTFSDLIDQAQRSAA